MNYPESAKLLEEIRKAKRILINCHRSPDADSIGSALAMNKVLTNMRKTVKLVYPGEELYKNFRFLKGFEKIEPIDFSKFDFSDFDLFIALDSSSWEMVSGIKEMVLPAIDVLVIDHHLTNTKYGKVNLVDEKVSSTGELLYRVLEDWGVEIEKDVATPLLTGIIGDTGVFRYPGVGSSTLEAAGKLIGAGADKDRIVSEIYASSDIKLVKFWVEILQNMQVDDEFQFVWSAVPYEKYSQLGSLRLARESAAGQFAAIVEGTNFGIIMIEQEPKKLSVSLRSRSGFDTTKVALALGGGGHIFASGAKVEGLAFDQAVIKVLETARKFANENKP
jgi:phosphoesterase RecJ-like protein